MEKGQLKKIMIPRMKLWDRVEFVTARRKLDEFNNIPIDEDGWKNINCSFCVKPIMDLMVWVVDYGDHVACSKCYQIRYSKLKQHYRQMIIPPTMPEPLDAVDLDTKLPTEESTDLSTLIEKQDQNVTQVRDSFKKD